MLAAAMGMAVFLGSCGKKGPPQPPVRVAPAPPGAVQARQVGPDVILAAALTGRRTDGTPLPQGSVVELLRMPATESLRPGAVSERYLAQQFLRQARPRAVLEGPALHAAQTLGRVVFADRVLGDAGGEGPEAAASTSYLYGMQVVEPGGRRSFLRRPVLVEVGPPPEPPGAARAEVAEGEVRLAWDPPVSGPASYNVYRRVAGEAWEPGRPLNPAPVDTGSFVDRSFAYDTEYTYIVRSVDPGQASLRESVAGPPVEVRPHDRFAPSAPTGIAVAVEGGQIRIYWFPSTEADLAGYRIYRRAESESVFRPIGEVSAGDSAFVDPGPVPGVRYHYAVSAFDGATPANESPRSEERSEMLPADPPDAGSGAGSGA